MDLPPFPWLTAQHVRNEYPQPAEAKIVAAARDVPDILSDLKPDSHGDFACTADYLIESLRKTGHNRAAAAWAVYQGILEEMLRVKLTHSMSPECVRILMGDNPNCVVPSKIPLDRYYYLKEVTVVSTDALWEWNLENEAQTSTSPLSEYIRFLTVTYQGLIDWTRRDEEAIRLLTDHSYRQLKVQAGSFDYLLSDEVRRSLRHPRIWTQRDQRFLDFRAGKIVGRVPVRRTSYYLHRLSSREGAFFNSALNEARQDGLVVVLGVKLNDAHVAFEKLYDTARSFTQGHTTAQVVSDEAFRMGAKIGELMDYVKTPQATSELRPAVLVQTPPLESPPDQPSPSEGANTNGPSETQKNDKSKQKRNGRRSDQTNSEILLIAALTEHHKYGNGSIGNETPIGCRELGRRVGLSEKPASVFFKNHFGSHKKYQGMCRDVERFIAAMKALNAEFSPKDFYTARTPEDIEREAEPLE